MWKRGRLEVGVEESWVINIGHMRINFKFRHFIEYKRYIHLDTRHVRDMKLGMYLTRVKKHISGFQISKFCYFRHFKAKTAISLIWPPFLAHIRPKKQNLEIWKKCLCNITLMPSFKSVTLLKLMCPLNSIRKRDLKFTSL